MFHLVVVGIARAGPTNERVGGLAGQTVEKRGAGGATRRAGHTGAASEEEGTLLAGQAHIGAGRDSRCVVCGYYCITGQTVRIHTGKAGTRVQKGAGPTARTEPSCTDETARGIAAVAVGGTGNAGEVVAGQVSALGRAQAGDIRWTCSRAFSAEVDEGVAGGAVAAGIEHLGSGVAGTGAIEHGVPRDAIDARSR